MGYVPLAQSAENLPCATSLAQSPHKEKLAETCVCGRAFSVDAKFCQICGKPRPKVDPSRRMRIPLPPPGLGDQDINAGQKETNEKRREGDVGVCFGDHVSKLTYAETVDDITTFLISGIPQACSAEQFRDIVSEGFKGAIDFLYTPCDRKTGVHMNLAVINLVDASHAQALRWALKCSFSECEMVPAQVQGYKACTGLWGSVGDVAKTKLQIKQQFQKTKMCAFFMRGKCLRGGDCVYAHSRAELQQNPDLTKTRLCGNFLRQKCFEPDCKFAHGRDELRSTDGVYKTVPCWWAATGSCKSGAACRFAHTPEEMRPAASGPTPTNGF